MSTFRFAGWLALTLILWIGQRVLGQTRDNDELIRRYMTSIPTELIGKLSTKNATPGQQIAVRTKQAVQLANGTALPLGTVLAGHVIAVQPKTEEHDYAMLSVIFDHAEIKGAQPVPLRASIQMVSGPTPYAGTNSGYNGAVGPIPGINGGQPAPALGSNRRHSPDMSTTTPSTGLAPPADAGPTPGAPAATAAGGETVGSRPQATGLPGVMLSNTSSAELSGTLSEFGKNIDLSSGVEIRLGVIGR